VPPELELGRRGRGGTSKEAPLPPYHF